MPYTNSPHAGQQFGFVPKHEKMMGNGDAYAAAPATMASYGDSAYIADGPVFGGPDGVYVPDDRTFLERLVPIGQMGTPYWGRIEYLSWSTERMNVPILATTSTAGTAQDDAGVLGLASTSVLYGDRGLTNSDRSGGRFTLGRWLNDCQTEGWDITYIVLESETDSFSADETTRAILARPFFNTVLDAEDSRLIAFPTFVEGSLQIDSSTEFQTAGVVYRRATMRSDDTDVDISVGYRYARVDDELRFRESTTGLSGPAQGAEIDLTERFRTSNDFNGGQIGIRSVHRPTDLWSLELLSNFGFGSNRSVVDISGTTTTTTDDDVTSTTTGGLYAQGTNIGRTRRNEFSTFSEFDLTLRRRLRSGATLNFGYTFLLWTDIIRAGDQLDRQINTSQIPPGTLNGAARPAVPLKSTDFWAQGLHTGLEFAF
jgi:hypothetical protein